ncbi:MAG TPA: hypothetical protein VMW75_27040 [Thermoanaerobaculia bacterium]|nr:hypothetical protein [Thermoanaerobaculia bacterium]
MAAALGVAALLAGQGAASAQNLVVNPDFDTSLNGWVVTDMVSWDGTLDAGASPGSGSAKGVFDAPAATQLYPVISQCLPLDIGTTYHFGGDIFIHPGNTAPGSAFYSVIPFPTADCSGPPPPGGPFGTTPPVTAAGSWNHSVAAFSNTFASSAVLAAYLAPQSGGIFTASFDDVVLAPGALTCTPDPHTLCLLGSRFSVAATFDTGGNPSSAQAVPIGRSGYFWFFDAGNVEVLVKMVDGCSLNGAFWFFAAGLTNVHVTITVADTQTGAIQIYTNAQSTPFQPIQDTSAFACP